MKMNQSKEAINFFEQLATNAHHRVFINEMLLKQSPEIKDLYLSNSSECIRKYFNTTGYLADSIKVTEI